MKLFIDRLLEMIKKKNSRVCVGLDPHLHLLPPQLVKQAMEIGDFEEMALGMAVSRFNRKIIDSVADVAVAVKPQIAFYEQIGSYGIIALAETVEYAREKGLLVILDAKRNDIGSTAAAYASAYLDEVHLDSVDTGLKSINPLVVDAMTINPYLGFDGVDPFLENRSRGAFALVRTSNKSAGQIQDLKLENGKLLYRQVGELVSDWGDDYLGEGGYSNLGAVVGATYPGELALLRKDLPSTFFLIPGYGAQGGSAGDIVAGFDDRGLGAVVNSSRGIIFAYCREPWSGKYGEEQFAEAARSAAVKMKDEINKVLSA
ncbi:MAG: orotidine-5'-phosphate decarboxylase [Halanaerobiaceae bacterium]